MKTLFTIVLSACLFMAITTKAQNHKTTNEGTSGGSGGATPAATNTTNTANTTSTTTTTTINTGTVELEAPQVHQETQIQAVAPQEKAPALKPYKKSDSDDGCCCRIYTDSQQGVRYEWCKNKGECDKLGGTVCDDKNCPNK